jgi:cell division septation protein DedD
LFNGDGVQQNPVLGYAYVSRAAAQGLGPAKETLAQLDRILPLEDRRRGVAIAIDKARAAPAPTSKPARPARTATTTPAKTPPKAASPTPAAAASGAWRIQLGAFSQRASAEALFRKLSGNSALTGRRAFYVPAGAVTRLQVGPFESKAAAAAACRAIGQACFPVPAR